jgi:hypothetical protein
MQNNPKAQLAERVIGEPLGDWVRRHREDGRSWQWIANQVLLKSDGKVSITAAYLHRLFADEAVA